MRLKQASMIGTVIPKLLLDEKRMKSITSIDIDLGSFASGAMFGTLWIFYKGTEKLSSYNIESNDDYLLALQIQKAFMSYKEF